MALPVDEILGQLKIEFETRPVLVLEAPPGAGKTTRVPPALLEADWLNGQKILMLEPRRLAARNAAEFMSRQRGEIVGQTIGYSIRHEHRTSSQTRIEVITEGILTRRLQSDPELSGVGLVIFDEFHERNIHSDLALALTNDLRKGLREDLRMLVMSATLETEPLVKLLDAGLLRSEGQSWPVEFNYLGGEIELSCVTPICAAIKRACHETSGDILAFLPGVREIEQTRKQLHAMALPLQICPLHSRLSTREQQHALQKSAQRKLILSTNIAETSLTIDGISTVVDSGLCRQPGFDPSSGLSSLRTTRISRASSRQRAGRAGRQGPGTCYRLWSESVQEALLPQTPPEIRSADLVPLVLNLSAWGLQDSTQLDWLDPPSPGALQAAWQLLQQLDLCDRNRRLTPSGQQAVKLPVHPRFARLLLAAEEIKLLPVACLLVTFLENSAGASNPRGDFLAELRQFALEMRTGQKPQTTAARTFKQLAASFNTRLPQSHEFESDQLSKLLACAYPERVAWSRQKNTDYLLASGRGARLHSESPLRNHAWLVITDINLNDQDQAFIRRALPLPSDWVRDQIKAAPWQEMVVWDNQRQRVWGRRVKKIGAIELISEHLAPATEKVQQILCDKIRIEGDRYLNWSPETKQLLHRLQLLRRTFNDPWPELSLTGLLEFPEDWLAPYLDGISTASQLKKLDLKPALHGLLDWKRGQELSQLTPLRIKVPSGEMMKIDYQPTGPTLPAKLQQLFGLAETPSICRGQVPLRLQLLSPANRPLAVTSDLRNFWNKVYPEVRKEMRGRYPKHPWPEDPWQAAPSRRTKKKARG